MIKQALAAQKVTVEQIKSDARTEIMVTKMLQGEVEGKVTVTPANVTSFYQNNPDQFKQGERVHASHILLSFPHNADAAAKQLPAETQLIGDFVLRDQREDQRHEKREEDEQQEVAVHGVICGRARCRRRFPYRAARPDS